MFIILYNLWLLSCLFLLCKSLNMHALAETYVVCVTTASPFLSCQVYITSIIHISKRIYFQFYLSIHFGWPQYIIKVAQNNATHGSVIRLYVQNSRLLCRSPGNTALYPHHTTDTSTLRWHKKLESNLIIRLICIKRNERFNIFWLIACINVLTLTPLYLTYIFS